MSMQHVGEHSCPPGLVFNRMYFMRSTLASVFSQIAELGVFFAAGVLLMIGLNSLR